MSGGAGKPKIWGLFSPPKFEKDRAPAWKGRLAKKREERGRNEVYYQGVGKLPCTLCPERRGVRPYLLASSQTDAWVPLCLVCRSRVSGINHHREERFFLERGISPYALAQGLREKAGDAERMAMVLLRFKLQAEGLQPENRQRGR